MDCMTCRAPLASEKTGFVVCGNCGVVNHVGDAQFRPQIPDYRRRIPRKLLLITGASLLAVMSLVGFYQYQNSRSASLLRSAQQQISKGKYRPALDLLEQAQAYHSVGGVNAKIASLLAKDKIWTNDEKNFELASQLVGHGQYDQAAAILRKISSDFPGRPKVLALQSVIAQHDAAVAATQAKAAPVNQATVQTKPATLTQPAKVTATPAKRFTSTAALSNLASATSISGAQQALQSFASQYGLTMEVTSVMPSSYASQYDSYTLLAAADLGNLKTYGSLFIDEWAKYPTDWVTNSKLKSVALVKNFATSGTHRAAGPDPYGETMYYDVTYSGDYAREVLHHEFDHLITYNYFGSYAPSDPTWQSYNPPGFNYGNGGASCYQPSNSCLSGEHPVLGFVTGYGTSAIEEDKAELYGYLMTDTYYHHLTSWLPNDSRLTAKVASYKQFISSHSPEMTGSYFDQINP